MLLSIEELEVHYATRRGRVLAVDGVSFHLNRGEALGIIGESGSGKTTLGLSILKLLPPEGRIVAGRIMYRGVNLVKLSDEEIRRRIRWREISMIFQGAMNALNPVYRAKDQIVEAILAHEHVARSEAEARALELISMVGLDPERGSSYPHELSGGMQQRILIAMALALEPKIVIADEPTTALDVITQRQILSLLAMLRVKLGCSLILISHDVALASSVADRIIVMYAGKIVESAPTDLIIREPLHPYTRGLIEANPPLTGPRVRLVGIPGVPPDMSNPPMGCRFHPRCPSATGECKINGPSLVEVGKGHYVACLEFGA